jgi:crossover junction endodeoxyribonuclease RuvC
MKILGIDPGLNITGYGIIEIAGESNPQLFAYGHIRTPGSRELAQRLHHIYTELNRIIQEDKPDIVAIESIFYAENVKTAIVMGHARGVAIVAAMNNAAEVREFSPREIKMSVVGNGAAVKEQVKFMVRQILRVREEIQPDDASDAIAVALCCWHRLKDVRLRAQ